MFCLVSSGPTFRKFLLFLLSFSNLPLGYHDHPAAPEILIFNLIILPKHFIRSYHLLHALNTQNFRAGGALPKLQLSSPAWAAGSESSFSATLAAFFKGKSNPVYHWIRWSQSSICQIQLEFLLGMNPAFPWSPRCCGLPSLAPTLATSLINNLNLGTTTGTFTRHLQHFLSPMELWGSVHNLAGVLRFKT